MREVTKVIDEKIKQIASPWLECGFLEKFKEIGNKYTKQLEVSNEKFRINQKPCRVSR